tara:strand:- start:253 stop:1014 length:762 start_codon:yes stop_codon:yes gene_type:complete
MGALHDGHISLILESIKVCQNTVVSIYINPTQFAAHEDLDNYPSLIDEDIKLLQNYKIDCLFIPSNEVMYKKNFELLDYTNNFFFILEGKSRPHFFKGVTTIVSKLFHIVAPSHAFFGEKDFQQVCVIKKMVQDLGFCTKIVSCPIIREENGLAMSSRNKYLDKKEYLLSGCLYKALQSGKKMINSGERDPIKIKDEISSILNNEPLFKIDYISVADKYSMEELIGKIDKDIVVSAAVYLGKTRLIDNFNISL